MKLFFDRFVRPLFISCVPAPRVDKPVYRTWHITDGHGMLCPKKCRHCDNETVEIVDRGKAVCCRCGENQ